MDNNKAAVSRREFGALSLGAGLATVANAPANAAAPAITETEVTVKTPDGMCDAAFIHPATGSYPGVLIWTDVFGLRPSMRGFARRQSVEHRARPLRHGLPSHADLRPQQGTESQSRPDLSWPSL